MEKSYIQDPDFAIIIEAYRKSLVRRYSPENVSRFPDLKGVDRKVIDNLVRYFLELLYPQYVVRLKLDNAFKSLSGFVKSPRKFLGVIGNMGYAVFKFGKHLFGGIKAGTSALHSYITAHKFENTLFHYAKPMLEKKMDIYDEKVFFQLLAKIPYEEAQAFRQDIISLFKTLSNRDLLDKIILINEHVIEKMKEKTDLYTPIEIEGIEMGLNILKKGKEVFAMLSDDTIQIVIKGIDLIEKDFFDVAYKMYPN